MEEDFDSKTHWDTVYQTKADNQLGWYEESPETTMALIAKCDLVKDATILNVGAGTTILIDALLDKGYINIIANDLSQVALQKLENRIHEKYNHNLNCIIDDLTNPKQLNLLKNVDFWIDRAVLHFFLKEEEQQTYFDLIQKSISKGGYVLIAVFSLDGAEKCCGLDLQRYNVEMLRNRLGKEFKLIDSFNHTYINPFAAERPYIYTLFKRE